MKRDEFFIIDESGHRHLAADVDRLRRGGPARWLMAIISLIGLAASLEWRKSVLGDNVLAYVAIYACFAFFAWRLVHCRATIVEFDRQWLYHQRDEALSIAQTEIAAATTGGQPTGYQSDEQSI